MSLRVNTIVGSIGDPDSLDETYRILSFDIEIDAVWMIRLAKPWGMPLRESYTEIESSLHGATPTRQIRTMRRSPYATTPEEELKENVKKTRAEAWEAIKPLVEGMAGRNLPGSNDLGRKVASRAAEAGKPRKTIYRMLYRYWACGMNENACLPDWPNCGRSNEPRNGKQRLEPLPAATLSKISAEHGAVAEGSTSSPNDLAGPAESPGDVHAIPPRKRIGRSASPATIAAGGVVLDFNASPEDLAIFKVALDLYYESEGGNLRQVYNRMVRSLYIAGYENKGGLRVPIPLDANIVPSFRMFEYAYHRDADHLKRQIEKYGKIEVAQNLRPILGRGRENVIGIGDRFQIDATLADIYIVNRIRRDWLVGRPVVYLVVDTFSTMIVGLFVGLWGPSWDCARLALINAFTEKVSYCARYGIPISHADWPCDITCAILGADRQELLSEAASLLQRNLSIHVEIAPAYRPDLKFIETRFRLINIDSKIKWLPGGVNERAAEKGRRDYRLDAVLDIYQFTRILIKTIIHYNKFHFSPQHRLTHPALAKTSFPPTPLNFWAYADANGLGSLRRDDPDTLKFCLLPTASASITERDIVFKDMRYSSDRSLEENWAAHARANGRTTVTVSYHREWTDEIWLRDTETGLYESAYLRSVDDLYRGQRHEDVEVLTTMNAVKPASLVNNDRASGAELDAFIDNEVAEAERLKAAANSSTSNAQKIANIREHRKESADSDRARQAREIYARNATASRSPDPDDSDDDDDSNVIDLLRKARKEDTKK